MSEPESPSLEEISCPACGHVQMIDVSDGLAHDFTCVECGAELSVAPIDLFESVPEDFRELEEKSRAAAEKQALAEFKAEIEARKDAEARAAAAEERADQATAALDPPADFEAVEWTRRLGIAALAAFVLSGILGAVQSWNFVDDDSELARTVMVLQMLLHPLGFGLGFFSLAIGLAALIRRPTH